jgi:hypothetical protein
MLFLTTGMIHLQGVKRKSLFGKELARSAAPFALRLLGALLVCFAGVHPVCGQDQPPGNPSASSAPAPPDAPPSDETPSMFPHFESSRIWISGQANFITQWHPNFHSPYQGPNSLSPQAQDASSRVLTLVTGLRLSDTSEILLDVQ